ncbi:MAG: 3-keto-5-aminohexanoate cleavage protein [Woeseia sp.]
MAKNSQPPHQQFAANRLMVMAAPNGARRTRIDHPALPITPAELAACARQLVAVGVSVLHLHVRDEQGQHTLDVARYRDAITAIRAAVGDELILQVTTEAVGRYRADEQMNTVRELRPEAVSIALRELCPDGANEKECAQFFDWLHGERIWPQLILYNADDLRRFDAMRRRGIFATEQPHCLFVLGRYADNRPGDPAELDALLEVVDCSEFPWSVCCFGATELSALQHAARRGGHVRLGFENNLLLADGSVAGDNAVLAEQFIATTRMLPRRPATAAEVREQLLSLYA